MPDGMYGTYEGLMNHMFLHPDVPTDVKEGLRYLSATRIGCEFCRTFRAVDSSGRRVLSDDFYVQAAEAEPDWRGLVRSPWCRVFAMAEEVLAGDGEISPETYAVAKEQLTDAQTVQAIFYMLLVGASHRFAHALGIPAVCAVPSLEQPV
jgi:hypothetical protein